MTTDVFTARVQGTPRDALPVSRQPSPVTVRRLGLTDYLPAWRAMQEFTAQRSAQTGDEIWLTEHRPVYTLGVAARPEHLPRGDNRIEVIRTDRGGQITYHGPGQLVAYLLLDLKRRGVTVRQMVRSIEQAVIDLLAERSVDAGRRAGAPGVYVGAAKIAALGLRVRGGGCYHGVALNVDMDLAPFAAIDPCGYPGLAVTQLRDLGVAAALPELGERLAHHLLRQLA
ncbi:MAG TPA: lipoyl(octanoyl) transferase LipB [Burkholderiales bacterium]|nr:lipoyl(octanoyl) transferase LipB [Burkholderiales bacterium]